MSEIGAQAAGTPAGLAVQKLEVARAAGATWRVFRQAPWRFAVLAIIPILATAFIVVPVAFMRARTGAATTTIDSILTSLVQYGTQFTCQNAGIWGAARLMGGQPMRLGPALRAGISRLLPVFGVVVISLIVFVVGFIVFVIPGLIALIFLLPAVPACVIEEIGPLAALDRSVRLVRGNWWRVVGTLLLGGLVPLIAAGLVVGVVFAALSPLHAGPWALLFIVPLYPVFISIGVIMPAVVFLDLRAAKEGLAPSNVAGVFD